MVAWRSRVCRSRSGDVGYWNCPNPRSAQHLDRLRLLGEDVEIERGEVDLRVRIPWLPTAARKFFDLFIGGLQAVIFALLTLIYFGEAVETSEEI
ncbi:MAG: hypothetical protein EKK42_08815 [Pseudonocardiaceae bacterium]|nr:MAG: hypothetical protein EKK42_08815 [Pseudonocardiaceae bacterium]